MKKILIINNMSLYSIPFYNSLLRKKLFIEKEKKKLATNSHVLVYGAVSIHNLGEKGCIASNETIGKEIGMTAQTVANCLSDLNKAKWLLVVTGKGNRRLKIIPKLSIGLLNVDEPYSVEEGPYLPEEGTILQEVTPLTCTSNRDNILDKSLENSIDLKKVKEIINYFYDKIAPHTPFGSRYVKVSQDGARNLLKDNSIDTIKGKIDVFSKHPGSTTRFEWFVNKYSTIGSNKQLAKPMIYAVPQKPIIDNPNETSPPF